MFLFFCSNKITQQYNNTTRTKTQQPHMHKNNNKKEDKQKNCRYKKKLPRDGKEKNNMYIIDKNRINKQLDRYTIQQTACKMFFGIRFYMYTYTIYHCQIVFDFCMYKNSKITHTKNTDNICFTYRSKNNIKNIMFKKFKIWCYYWDSKYLFYFCCCVENLHFLMCIYDIFIFFAYVQKRLKSSDLNSDSDSDAAPDIIPIQHEQLCQSKSSDACTKPNHKKKKTTFVAFANKLKVGINPWCKLFLVFFSPNRNWNL